MNRVSTGCLVLACGNTLRGDDGVGPWLAAWAEERFRDRPEVRVIARQQWTPDLAEDIARASAVLFIDCSLASNPGSLRMDAIQPSSPAQGLATHHQDPAELLHLALQLFQSLPPDAQLLTIGATSTELGEEFSGPVRNKLPQACSLIERTILQFLSKQISASSPPA